MRCPVCGNTTRFGYLEAIEHVRAVYGVGENGEMLVHDAWDDFDDEPLRTPQFQCEATVEGKMCGHRWDVPDWMRIEWTDRDSLRKTDVVF